VVNHQEIDEFLAHLFDHLAPVDLDVDLGPAPREVRAVLPRGS
jgi:hypothetical protein